MSKIEELINKYCPNGVEFKRVGDICKITKGKQFNKRDMAEKGHYPVFNGGIGASGYVECYNEEENTITISQGGASAGYVNWQETKFWAGAHCYVIEDVEEILDKYLYYFIKSNENKLMQCQYGAGIPALSKAKIENLKIPIPPSEIQTEIIKVLDVFTNLDKVLKEELDARRKQYEYYCDHLFEFSKTENENIVNRKLGDIGFLYGGISGKNKEDFKNGNAPFITYMDVYQNIEIKEITGRVKMSELDHQTPIEYGDVFFTESSETPDECAISSVLTKHLENKVYLNSFCFGYRLNNKSMFDLDYLKHYFRSYAFRTKISKAVGGVTRFNVSKKQFAKIEIPVPPLEMQHQIAQILNCFESFCLNQDDGLPAEIIARERQYKYYREKLLRFNELS